MLKVLRVNIGIVAVAELVVGESSLVLVLRQERHSVKRTPRQQRVVLYTLEEPVWLDDVVLVSQVVTAHGSLTTHDAVRAGD